MQGFPTCFQPTNLMYIASWYIFFFIEAPLSSTCSKKIILLSNLHVYVRLRVAQVENCWCSVLNVLSHDQPQIHFVLLNAVKRLQLIRFGILHFSR